MSRGLWRWWETKDGADVWWARVEERPGQWRDVSQSEYERAALQPPFWNLPLQEEAAESAINRRLLLDEPTPGRRDFEFGAIIVIMLAFCVLFVVYVVGEMLLVRLGMLH